MRGWSIVSWLLDSVAYYLDDVLINTREMGEHLDVVDQVLQTHLEASIRLKPSKTLFFRLKWIS